MTALRSRLRLALVGAVLLCLGIGSVGPAFAAGTAPGTQITNTATATYTDSNNQNYSTQSNTVTTTVQNAPSLTEVGPAAQNVSPGETVVDTYTVTNTGNAAANFVIPSTPTISTGTITGYTLSLTNTAGTVYNPCTVASPCSLATLQTDLASASATVPNTTGGSGSPVATIGIVYSVSSTIPTTTSSIVTTLPTEITQAAAGTAPAVTSAASSATVTDTEHPDARVDLNKAATAPTVAGGNITYSFGVNNGGYFGAHDLTSAQTLLGATSPGIIAVLDKLPSYGAFQQSYVLGSSVLPTTLTTGQTATVYLSLNGTSWVKEASATGGTQYTYVALYLSGGAGGVELAGNPSGSTGSGSSVTNPQITYTFGGTSPTGTGSGNPNLSNIANSIIGGNPWDNGSVPIIAPGVTSGTTDASVTTPSTTYGPTINNVTSSPSNSVGTAGGASNTVLVGGAVTNAALNGPVGLPAATGDYDGSGSAIDNQHDFTDLSFPCTSGGTGSTASINNGTTACTWPTAGVAVPNTLENNGSSPDSFSIAVTPPTGYAAAIYLANSCPTTTLATAILPIAPYGTAGSECVEGTALTVTSAGGVYTAAAASNAGLQSVASGASVNYIVVYTAINGTVTQPFTALNAKIAAYGSTGTAGTAGADSNDTYDTLYPGGPVKLTKSAATVTGCPAGASPAPAVGTVCPGGTVTYSIVVANTAPSGIAATGSGSANGEPAFAIAGTTIKGGTVVTEDGTGAGSWFTPTYGIDATVAPSFPVNTTIAYTTTGTGSTSTLHPTGGGTKGPSGFTVTFTNALTAGYTGTISFQVTIQ